ncbi:MAG: ATPase domain-containing protein, partial [Thermodesulfobacteriota bacterium]|nr:ATPase domain-containing protein [Thermodesulfobacteriota bacterium]
MKKQPKYIFICQSCGYQTPKWIGRCPDCEQWNSFVEEAAGPGIKSDKLPVMGEPQAIDAISLYPEFRFKTGITEFDRTLGGGLVPGSMVLIGGDPGVGKSTIILQVVGRLSMSGLKSLYLSGEESPQQIKLRA